MQIEKQELAGRGEIGRVLAVEWKVGSPWWWGSGLVSAMQYSVNKN